MDIDSMALDIAEALRKRGRGSRQDHRPSTEEDFGVYASDLRTVVREFKKRLEEHTGDAVYQLGIRLISLNIRECRQVAYELIGGHREARESLNISRIEALGAGIDNWASVDGFCCTLVGQAWREGQIPDATILRWSGSENIWWRRAAVVATIPLNVKSRGGTGDTKRTLTVCRILVSDNNTMVQKAISWALRELITWDREAVVSFLEEQRDAISARVRREVSTKLKTGKKQ